MKETLKKLRELARMSLTEGQCNEIEDLVKNEKWNQLRLFIGDLSEELEIRLIVQGSQDKRDEWLAVDMMNDIAIDLAIQMNEADEEKSTRRTRRKRIVRV